ncbi:MAG: histidine kinase, partial [Phycisphaeraceae bacterium]
MLPAGVYTCDRDGMLAYYNHQAAALWGRQPELGKQRWCGSLRIYNLDGTLLPHEASPLAVAVREDRAIDAGQVFYERPNGSRVCVQAQAQPVRGEGETLLGGVNVVVDVTAMQQMSQSLEQQIAQRTAEAHQRADDLHALASELIHAEERERQRVAQLLHDDLQQTLAAARWQLEAVRRGVTHEPHANGLGQVQSLLDDAIHATRSLTAELSPPVL